MVERELDYDGSSDATGTPTSLYPLRVAPMIFEYGERLHAFTDLIDELAKYNLDVRKILEGHFTDSQEIFQLAPAAILIGSTRFLSSRVFGLDRNRRPDGLDDLILRLQLSTDKNNLFLIDTCARISSDADPGITSPFDGRRIQTFPLHQEALVGRLLVGRLGLRKLNSQTETPVDPL